MTCPRCGKEEHEAGRETDACVAELVMELTPSKAVFAPDGIANVWENDDLVIYLPDWQPSTNIADAWSVVEKFCESKGLAPELWWSRHPPHLWRCEFGIGLGFYADANTASLAICRAALKAVQG